MLKSFEGHSADPNIVWVPSMRDALLPSEFVWLQAGIPTVTNIWSTGELTTEMEVLCTTLVNLIQDRQIQMSFLTGCPEENDN